MTTYFRIMSYVLFGIMLRLWFYGFNFEFTAMSTCDVNEDLVWPLVFTTVSLQIFDCGRTDLVNIKLEIH